MCHSDAESICCDAETTDDRTGIDVCRPIPLRIFSGILAKSDGPDSLLPIVTLVPLAASVGPELGGKSRDVGVAHTARGLELGSGFCDDAVGNEPARIEKFPFEWVLTQLW